MQLKTMERMSAELFAPSSMHLVIPKGALRALFERSHGFNCSVGTRNLVSSVFSYARRSLLMLWIQLSLQICSWILGCHLMGKGCCWTSFLPYLSLPWR